MQLLLYNILPPRFQRGGMVYCFQQCILENAKTMKARARNLYKTAVIETVDYW